MTPDQIQAAARYHEAATNPQLALFLVGACYLVGKCVQQGWAAVAVTATTAWRSEAGHCKLKPVVNESGC